jgi:hypothetical protein
MRPPDPSPAPTYLLRLFAGGRRTATTVARNAKPVEAGLSARIPAAGRKQIENRPPQTPHRSPPHTDGVAVPDAAALAVSRSGTPFDNVSGGNATIACAENATPATSIPVAPEPVISLPAAVPRLQQPRVSADSAVDGDTKKPAALPRPADPTRSDVRADSAQKVSAIPNGHASCVGQPASSQAAMPIPRSPRLMIDEPAPEPAAPAGVTTTSVLPAEHSVRIALPGRSVSPVSPPGLSNRANVVLPDVSRSKEAVLPTSQPSPAVAPTVAREDGAQKCEAQPVPSRRIVGATRTVEISPAAGIRTHTPQQIRIEVERAQQQLLAELDHLSRRVDELAASNRHRSNDPAPSRNISAHPAAATSRRVPTVDRAPISAFWERRHLARLRLSLLK